MPDRNYQLVRYCGWYSNKMRGQRDKRAAEEAKTAGNAVQIIDVIIETIHGGPLGKRQDSSQMQ